MIRNLSAYFSQPHSRSVGLVFSINSFMFGNWVARIPEIKLKLSLTEGSLGLALLGLPIGAVIIMPAMGWLIKKYGAGKVTLISNMLFCVFILFPVMAGNFFWLVTGLIAAGAANGATDIAMNAAAANIEKKQTRNIMATSHGMWSLGSMIGASVGGLFAQWEIVQIGHMTMLTIMMLLLNIVIYKPLLGISDTAQEGKNFVLPKGPILALSVITFCILMAEGSIADWSALFIGDVLGSNKIVAALGYAGFSFSMTLGRFYGDNIIPKYNKKHIIKFCSLIAGMGILLPVFFTSPLLAIIGFTIAGFGYSLLIPVVFSAAANIRGISPGTGLAMVATMGYAGFLVGPPTIGFVAETFNLTFGIGFIALITIIVFLISLMNQTESS